MQSAAVGASLCLLSADALCVVSCHCRVVLAITSLSESSSRSMPVDTRATHYDDTHGLSREPLDLTLGGSPSSGTLDLVLHYRR